MELNFKLEGQKVYLVKGNNNTEVGKEVMLEMCHLLLGNLNESRDYTSVTSIKKLFNIIDIECQPDESEGSEVSEIPVETVKKPVARRPANVKKTPAAAASLNSSEEE